MPVECPNCGCNGNIRFITILSTRYVTTVNNNSDENIYRPIKLWLVQCDNDQCKTVFTAESD